MKSLPTIWIEPPRVSVPAAFQGVVGGHSLISETLYRRGITTYEGANSFLHPSYQNSIPPLELPDLGKAVERILFAIDHKEPILVWGDFDVDGQTSTTLLYACLKRLGANITFHIPVRDHETHGISLPILTEYLNSDFRLLLTCDTGISAFDAVELAGKNGVDTIITDHHALPEDLPPAHSIVSSQRVPLNHPLHSLCGVGVVYKLLEELYSRKGLSSQMENELDLVSLGTVADIAILTAENRRLVQLGLERIRKNPRPAIKALLKLSGIDHEHITEEHFSFFIAPRLNAVGRLDDANSIVNFFMTQDNDVAEKMAARLDAINEKRKFESELVFQSARAMIERENGFQDQSAILVGSPEWPASVIGIVASRLAELYSVPVILFSSPPGSQVRGSARSVEGINIIEVISTQKEKLISFGGHPMAAGISLRPEVLDDFRREILVGVSRSAGLKPGIRQIPIDSYLPLNDISLDLVADINRIAPFGPGNPQLILAANNLTISSSHPVGKNGDHLSLVIEDSARRQFRVIWWHGDQSLAPEGRFDMAFSVRDSNYRGQKQVQMEWVGSRPFEEIIRLPGSLDKTHVYDHRSIPNPSEVLEGILFDEPLIFSEGETALRFKITDRYHLYNNDTLVIWNLPSGRAELLEVIKGCSSRHIHLFSNDPGSRQLNSFLKRLGGMLQYSINHDNGVVDPDNLAAATGHREITVQGGIDWFISHGDINCVKREGKTFILSRPGFVNTFKNEEISKKLSRLLDETEAYRNYYLRANPNHIIS